MLRLILQEHRTIDFPDNIDCQSIMFKGDLTKLPCLEVENQVLQANYYIGIDWLQKDEALVQVQPKLNKEGRQINYLEMLLGALEHTSVAKHCAEIYEIKFGEKPIEIEGENDLLFPLLAGHFLGLLKTIVKKGLKKSYYPVREKLVAKQKGKLLVGASLKNNLKNGHELENVCEYNLHGINSFENKILKKTLFFIQHYFEELGIKEDRITNLLNFCKPAFELVGDDVNVREIRNVNVNSFYKEYQEAIKLSKLILKRFGYNLKQLSRKSETTTLSPPFWIDMSLLFELYVLAKLKDEYKDKIVYQFSSRSGKPDFLFIDEENPLVIDTKYKPKYANSYSELDDIRQISAYSRDSKIRTKIKAKTGQLIDCLIIYPNQTAEKNLSFPLKKELLSGYEGFYKQDIALPEI